MSVEGTPVDDLHEELSGVTPGSPEERRILAKLRARRDHKTAEFRTVRDTGLERAAEHGVIDPAAAQQVAREAIDHITGEHELPAGFIDDPGPMH